MRRSHVIRRAFHRVPSPVSGGGGVGAGHLPIPDYENRDREDPAPINGGCLDLLRPAERLGAVL